MGSSRRVTPEALRLYVEELNNGARKTRDPPPVARSQRHRAAPEGLAEVLVLPFDDGDGGAVTGT